MSLTSQNRILAIPWALLLLALAAAPALFAQQPDAINRESQARVETPDPAIPPVDSDPEKATPDVPQQPQPAQTFSTWGMQRIQPQKPSLNPESAAQAAAAQSGDTLLQQSSIWGPATKRPNPTALLNKDATEPAPAAKIKLLKLRDRMAQLLNPTGERLSPTISGNAALSRADAGYLNPRVPLPQVDFSSPLLFDPMRQSLFANSSSTSRLGRRPLLASHTESSDDCRTLVSGEMKFLCMQSQQTSHKNTKKTSMAH